MDINEKIYRNVKALSKINGTDLKDVEKEIGNSAGYLSRKSTKISVEALIKLSEIFEVSADELMYSDFEHELQQKIAMDNLRDAVVAASAFFNREGILMFVQNALPEAKADE